MPPDSSLIDASLAGGLDLTLVLNAVASGRWTVPEAEDRLLADGRVHTVTDPTGVLGATSSDTMSLRWGLARVRPGPWALLLPTPGHPGGLRGPTATNAAALARGCAVVVHEGGVAWVCDAVGDGVAWQVLPAERPILPDPPDQVAGDLTATILQATRELGETAITGHHSPGDCPALGPDYPHSSQVLLERAWTVLAAATAGLAAGVDAVSSHQALRREKVLRPLALAAASAGSSAVSWPKVALVE